MTIHAGGCCCKRWRWVYSLPQPRHKHSRACLGTGPKQLPPGRSIYKLEGRVLVNGVQVTLETQIGVTETWWITCACWPVNC